MEILATIPVYSPPSFLCCMLFTVALIIALSGFTAGIFIAIDEKSWITCLVGLSLLVIGIVGIKHSLELRNELKVFKYNEYKVTIDETVNAREFLNQYEVLSREGEIFTIKEIEVDE
jgi:hypothetical protein